MKTTTSLKPWFVCACSAMFFFYQFMQFSVMDTLSVNLMHTFQLSQSGLAQISATYLLAVVIFYIPAGYLFDRYSIRRLILIALTMSALSAFGFASAKTIWMAESMRFISGIAHCFSFLGCMRLAARWLPSKLGLAMGMNFTIGFLGGVAAHTPLVYLMNALGWRQALMVNGGVGLALVLLIWLTVSDYPEGSKPESSEPVPLKRYLGQVVFHRQNWLCALYNMLLNLPIMLLAALWGTMYLMQQAGLTQLQASIVMSMIFNGAIVGAPLFGWLSERIQSRRYPIILGAVLALVTILLIFWLPNQSYLELLALYFILGVASGAQAVAYSAVTESNPSASCGLALSVTSIIILGGGGLAQKLFGFILEVNWSSIFPNLQLNQYDTAFLLLPLSFVITLLIALFIRETYVRQSNGSSNAAPSPAK